MTETLAPIALFVYNRPSHTLKTLEALAANDLAKDSTLYIFSDGPKQNADEETLNKINEVRKIIKQKQWYNEVYIKESETNKGLADSIIEGVTTIVNKHGKIIVLEDDIVVGKGFLKYMNSALNFYKNNSKVFHVSAYMFPVKGKLPLTFFYKQTSCWGWATWKDKWQNFEPSAEILMRKLIETEKLNYVDIDGTNQFVNQLKENIEGKLKSWAVLWHFSVFLKDGLSLHPYKPLVRNIGFDNTGTNCGESNIFDSEMIDDVPIKLIPVRDNQNVYRQLKNFYKKSLPSTNSYFTQQKFKSLINKFLKRIIHIGTKINENKQEMVRLKNLPRYLQAETTLLNNKIRLTDAASYIFQKEEIFDREIYKFDTKNSTPIIIDCGANIGLGIIYFKQLYPAAKIIAFEPDNKIFEVLQHNVRAFGFDNIQLFKKACWNKNGTIEFLSEGADAGRKKTITDDGANAINVETIQLGEFILDNIDLLKMDIEGAEFVVLNDIKNKLYLVQNIFVEYHSFINQEQYLSELLFILKNAGFRTHISSPGLTSPHPFITRLEYLDMDNQLNIYGFRE